MGSYITYTYGQAVNTKQHLTPSEFGIEIE